MSTVETQLPLMQNGDRMTREEFMRCWEAMPHLKFAELIGGVVYMPSPLSREHGDTDGDVGTWLGIYAAATPGTRKGTNATWLMLGDAPQPDNDLRILPAFGGQSSMEGPFSSGAPEFLTEICVSSRSYDLHQKLELYEEAGVREYLAVLMRERQVRWHRLIGKRFEVLSPSADGIYRSQFFPGLWLDSVALFASDIPRLLAVLNQGLATNEHAEFVARLARQKT